MCIRDRVNIASGKYPEQVNVTHSGTAEAPITFAGVTTPLTNDYYYPSSQVGGGFQGSIAHGFVLTGAQHVHLRGVDVSAHQEAVLINGGSDISISDSLLSGTFPSGMTPALAAVHVTGSASGVTIMRNAGPGIGGFAALDPGVQGTVISTNSIRTYTDAVVANGAPGTVVVSNTIAAQCNNAIVLTGASTGATVENNVISTSDPNNHANKLCAQAPSFTGLRVAAEAVAGTTVAYNAFDAQDGSPAYTWAGTTYSTVEAFAAASGQGSHDIVGDTELATWKGDSGGTASPLVDSADENAPGMSDRDVTGVLPVDDPWVADTGTGSGHRDRGSYEQTNFGTRYSPVGPVRVLDTRDGTGVGGAGAVAPGATVVLPVAGLHGVPATGVTGVTMNVTVTGPSAGGFLTVYPHGDDRPTASSLNWTPGETIPNLVTVQVKDGTVSFYNGSKGTVHVLADLLGYFSTTGSGFNATTPVRLLDTRNTGGVLPSGTTRDLTVAGTAGVPAGVTAVTMNVTVTQPGAGGYLTVYPHGDSRPKASNLNWSPGETIPNLVTVPVKDGRISFYNGSGGNVHVIADLAGYFTATGGDKYHALAPSRVIDTRAPWFADGVGEWEPAKPIAAGQNQDVRVSGYSGATSVAMNVTVTNTGAPGFMTAFPFRTTMPTASNLNWTAGQTIPNQAVVKVADDGSVSFHNGSGGNVDLIVDLNGYYAP